MDEKIIQKIIQVCDEKIEKKGENVGLSFYAFFANKSSMTVKKADGYSWV